MHATDQKFGITVKKETNFSEWYSQILLQGNMMDYYDVSGCYIMKPSSMFIWNKIKEFFNEKICELGVQECYFPMLLTKDSLEKEKGHLENFSPELAWITKCGEENIDVPVAVRPTSEAIMYPYFAKWIRSHRDLPLKLNQWCSVLRWEVKSTLPFIRGREFLWQEGHTVHLTKEESDKEVKIILDFYTEIYTELLAVPVIQGIKSENEKFGGASYTRTIETFISDTGKGIQAATSHSLGTNFSKMFEISVQANTEGKIERTFVYQNSWGITTRSIGIALMIHSDNKGCVLPPKICKEQIVIVPCGISDKIDLNQKNAFEIYVNEIINELKSEGLRVHYDNRENYSPGYKFNYWEIQGVPIRLEIGLRDFNKNEVVLVRRLDGKKRPVKNENLGKLLQSEINLIHQEMYNKAKENLENKLVEVKNIKEFNKFLNKKMIPKALWCGLIECEENIKKFSTERNKDGSVSISGAKSLCIMNEVEDGKCFLCENLAKFLAIFGRTY
ncbi:prolyl-tRNA synthetase [Tubulinosema ratisbonensis]|uniref:Proline--tRNA ligase n=1 Tax=Tubulinosema ratisbonensis TaxID=291195 RepID=A0A437AQS2_9MICR|nr:prolyl-tRNA synthetase [Tubulinosema ratisbonensis]